MVQGGCTIAVGGLDEDTVNTEQVVYSSVYLFKDRVSSIGRSSLGDSLSSKRTEYQKVLKPVWNFRTGGTLFNSPCILL